jgi:putative transposase
MKHDYPRSGIGALCRLFGKTRHAYYDALWRKENSLVREDVVLQEVIAIRNNLPRVGTRKLHYLLQTSLESHHIKIGRDYLFDLLSEHKLLVRQRKRKAITTDSRHWMRKYSNLIRDMPVTRPEQVWVSDITYIRLTNQWGYLSLITDAYSRKIIGYCFRNDLMAEGCIEALQMALKNRMYHEPIIHHSDRGSQYCSHQYVNLLNQNTIGISMTENGDPYENALAERVNGIIKTEFNLHSSQLGFEQTYNQIKRSIKVYNEIRPHSSCDYLTPNQAHLKSENLKKRWKNYNKKYNNEKTGV